ncbi:MAG: zinc ribbon domain-containing protein [Methanobrevibacter sp.]|jgi:hypothetical protein|nr:zinc ribbon domain-containing protein [Methanobrevibacter sp.]
MVSCNYCGQENKDGNLKCSNCGKPLSLIWDETSNNIFKKNPDHFQKDDSLADDFKYNSLYKENKIYNKVKENKKSEISNFYMEWDVIVATALTVIILTPIFNRLFPPLGYIMPLLISLIYLLMAIKNKPSLIIAIPLSFIVTCAFTAFLSL